MGTWAEGNFDNDGAMAFLNVHTHQLVSTIEEIMADSERLGLDEDGEEMLMPSVELLCVLCERYNTAPPKEKTVQQWHKKYLKVFDKQIDDLDPEGDYKDRRRKVIEKTFRWLESLAQSFWDK